MVVSETTNWTTGVRKFGLAGILARRVDISRGGRELRSAMTKTENAEVFRRVIEYGFNEGRLDELNQFVAVDFVEHQFGGESGLRALKELVRGLRTAFPDLTMTFEDLVSTDDKVWARLRCRGTHKGPLMGIPPTGRRMDTMAIEIGRFSDGKLVEHWGVPDRFAAMTQLGLLPAPGEPRASSAR